jgi:hypothetical protein
VLSKENLEHGKVLYLVVLWQLALLRLLYSWLLPLLRLMGPESQLLTLLVQSGLKHFNELALPASVLFLLFHAITLKH